MDNKRLYKSSVIICCAVYAAVLQNISTLIQHWYVLPGDPDLLWRGRDLGIYHCCHYYS